MEIASLTIDQVKDGLRKRSFSATELAKDALRFAETENPKTNAYLHFSPERAMAAAALVDEKLARGEVSGVWYRERAETLSVQFDSQEAEQSVALTSEYTLLGPLAFQLRRLVTERLPVNAG